MADVMTLAERAPAAREATPLIAMLDDDSAEVRDAVAGSLNQLGVNRDVMVSALNHRDWQVRSEAAEVLTKFGDKQAVEPLMIAMRDENPTVRQNSAKALGSLKDKRAFDSLVIALRDQTVEVRIEAATSLGRLGDPRGVEPLLAMVRDRDPALSSAAAKALTHINTGSSDLVNTLLPSFSSNDWRTRAHAAEVIGSTNNARAVQPLIQLLDDKHGVVRYYATRGLVRLGVLAVPELVGALRSSDKDKRYGASQALREIGSVAVDPLIEIVNDPMSTSRGDAAIVLGHIGEPCAIPALIKALNDTRPEVKQYVAQGLGLLGYPAVRPLVNALTRQAEETAVLEQQKKGLLGRIGQKMTSPVAGVSGTLKGALTGGLKGFLAEAAVDNRAYMAYALGNISDPRAAKALIDVLGDNGNTLPVRMAAADALGNIKSPESASALSAGYTDPSNELALHCAMALGHIGDLGVPALTAHLRDSDPRSRLLAVEGLSGSTSQDSIAPLIQGLSDSDAAIRAQAAASLAEFSDDRVLDPLLAATHDKTNMVRRAALISSAKLGDRRVFEPLVSALKDPNPEVRMAAVQGMGELGDKRAVAALQHIVDEELDDEIRNLAVKVLLTLK